MSKNTAPAQKPVTRRPGRPFASFDGESLSRELAVSKALDIVADQNLDGLTIAALAKSLDISRAPIYALFRTRADLLAEISDVILRKIFLDETIDDKDWRDALRQLALRAFNTYRAYPGTGSHLSRTGFPDTDAGRKSARLLSGLMRKAGAPVELIPALIFASSSMIAGADLELSGQKDRDLHSAKPAERKKILATQRGKTLPMKALDIEMFLEANELVLLGIEALIKQHTEG